ncbi:phage head morphogenesis protein, partial [Serratia ureilytica]
MEAWYRRQLDRAVQELHNSTLYWLRAEYRQTGLAQDASPAIMMRDAMRKLSRRWR